MSPLSLVVTLSLLSLTLALESVNIGFKITLIFSDGTTVIGVGVLEFALRFLPLLTSFDSVFGISVSTISLLTSLALGSSFSVFVSALVSVFAIGTGSSSPDLALLVLEFTFCFSALLLPELWTVFGVVETTVLLDAALELLEVETFEFEVDLRLLEEDVDADGAGRVFVVELEEDPISFSVSERGLSATGL